MGNRCSVSVFFAQVGSQISPRRAKKDSNIPSPGRTRSVKCPTPGPTKTNKSPPLRPCWHWCANGCNSSQQCWDLQCIVGRIQPIRLCKPCVMSVRGASNVGRAAQTDPTLLRYASAITQQKRSVRSCWLKSLTGFKLCATTHNNVQQGVQMDATCNIQQCWEWLVNNVASICTQPYHQ